MIDKQLHAAAVATVALSAMVYLVCSDPRPRACMRTNVFANTALVICGERILRRGKRCTAKNPIVFCNLTVFERGTAATSSAERSCQPGAAVVWRDG